jgi:hypothetical protein
MVNHFEIFAAVANGTKPQKIGMALEIEPVWFLCRGWRQGARLNPNDIANLRHLHRLPMQRQAQPVWRSGGADGGHGDAV